MQTCLHEAPEPCGDLPCDAVLLCYWKIPLSPFSRAETAPVESGEKKWGYSCFQLETVSNRSFQLFSFLFHFEHFSLCLIPASGGFWLIFFNLSVEVLKLESMVWLHTVGELAEPRVRVTETPLKVAALSSSHFHTSFGLSAFPSSIPFS